LKSEEVAPAIEINCSQRQIMKMEAIMNRRFDIKINAGTFLICLIYILSFAVGSAAAREIAGIEVPESITAENKVLVLNGAGIRKKYFLKIYVGALYLPVRHSSVNEILADQGAKGIVMSFLYKEVSAEKLVDAWNEGFAGNSTPVELRDLQDRIDQFNSLFPLVRSGDEIRLIYLPQKGTQVWVNDTLKGSIAGEDFSQALLKIWLGEKPADASLKEAMLGKE
jgi:hypothetical protein